MGALRIERDDDVLRLTLARPESRNAFDAALIAELSEAFVDVAFDPERTHPRQPRGLMWTESACGDGMHQAAATCRVQATIRACPQFASSL